jgi:hypothetical protein
LETKVGNSASERVASNAGFVRVAEDVVRTEESGEDIRVTQWERLSGAHHS